MGVTMGLEYILSFPILRCIKICTIALVEYSCIYGRNVNVILRPVVLATEESLLF